MKAPSVREGSKENGTQLQVIGKEKNIMRKL
jgi:hypothetical protein